MVRSALLVSLLLAAPAFAEDAAHKPNRDSFLTITSLSYRYDGEHRIEVQVSLKGYYPKTDGSPPEAEYDISFTHEGKTVLTNTLECPVTPLIHAFQDIPPPTPVIPGAKPDGNWTYPPRLGSQSGTITHRYARQGDRSPTDITYTFNSGPLDDASTRLIGSLGRCLKMWPFVARPYPDDSPPRTRVP